MGDPKKTAALIVAGLGDKDSEQAEAPSLDLLMEELADALRAKDYAGAAQAFRAAQGVCGSAHEDDSEEL